MTRAELSVILGRLDENTAERERWFDAARVSLGAYLELMAPSDRERVLDNRVSRELGLLYDAGSR